MKRCLRCQSEKPLDSFGLNRDTTDGLTRWCRECTREARRKRPVKGEAVDKYVALAGSIRARAHGRLIRRAMTDRGLRAADVADAIGAKRQEVTAWLKGLYLPAIERAQQLSDLFMDERVLEDNLHARTVSCALRACRRSFIRPTRTRQRFCSPECWRLAKKGGATVTRHPAMEAIAAYCCACEPSGVCQTSDCQLRLFSPLPLVARASVRALARAAS